MQIVNLVTDNAEYFTPFKINFISRIFSINYPNFSTIRSFGTPPVFNGHMRQVKIRRDGSVSVGKPTLT